MPISRHRRRSRRDALFRACLVACLAAVPALGALACEAPPRDRDAPPDRDAEPPDAVARHSRLVLAPWHGFAVTSRSHSALTVVRRGAVPRLRVLAAAHVRLAAAPERAVVVNPRLAPDSPGLESIAFVDVTRSNGPVALDILRRVTMPLPDAPNYARPVVIDRVEGIALRLNAVRGLRGFTHEVRIYAVAPPRELHAPPGGQGEPPIHLWIPADVGYPPRVHTWETSQPLPLDNLTLRLPDPTAPADPRAAVLLAVRAVDRSGFAVAPPAH
jgi:hypothetical protein